MPLKAYQAVPGSLRSISSKVNGSDVSSQTAHFDSCHVASNLPVGPGIVVKVVTALCVTGSLNAMIRFFCDKITH